jgi:hypothetical protein
LTAAPARDLVHDAVVHGVVGVAQLIQRAALELRVLDLLDRLARQVLELDPAALVGVHERGSLRFRTPDMVAHTERQVYCARSRVRAHAGAELVRPQRRAYGRRLKEGHFGRGSA